MSERLVVIGGDAAGMSAASQARRRRGPDDLEIVAFERGGYTSYSACGIPYWVGDLVDGPDELVNRDPQTFRDRYSIDARVRHEVVGIDLDKREVTVRADGRECAVGFDQVVYAAGAIPIRPDLPGIDARGVFGVQTLDDGVAVRRFVDEQRPRRAVVVGCGYIGIEMAEALIRRGVSVVCVERGEQPMSTVDPDMGALVREAMSGLGIDVRTGETARSLDVSGGRVTGVSTDDGSYPADMVVLGLGVRPNTDLARDAGFPIGATGGIMTDRRMRVAVDGVDGGGVWAAGDCVESTHRITAKPIHIALGTHANKQGRVAGINIGGGYATFPGVIGTAVTKVCDLEVARTGLNSYGASAAGFCYVTATVKSTNRAGYFPGAKQMTVKLVAESGSGRLLGAQIVGRAEAAKRIDALAIAIWHGMTVEEMTGLDLGYAPPYAPVWDPILVAARKTAEAAAH